jgi:DNA polymerase V
METKVKAIYSSDPATSYQQPLFVAKISAGFPSPADDYEEGKLDLNKHLIQHPAATFFVRVSGDSMIKAGIHPNDLLIVDRSLEPKDKNVVIANLNGELTVKRIRIQNNQLVLEAENDHYAPQAIEEGMEFEVWGVVTNVIHSL